MLQPDYKQMLQIYEAFDLPPMIIIDVTNTCNLKCIHCPQPSIQSKQGFVKQHLDMRTFTRLIADVATSKTPIFLRFVGDGEPTLHPQIIEMLVMAKACKQAVVNLTTNGTRLTDHVSEALVQGGIDMIDISLDAHTKTVYEMVRKEGNYTTVLRNVLNLIALRDKYHSKTKILVSFVRQNENERELESFKAFWDPLADFVVVRNLHSANNKVKVEESALRNRERVITRYPCPHLWKRLVVDYQGRIKFCPTDWGSGSVIGDVFEPGLRAAWRSLSALRNEHCLARISPDSICSPCGDWASTQWDEGYERIVDSLVFEAPTLCPTLPLIVKQH